MHLRPSRRSVAAALAAIATIAASLTLSQALAQVAEEPAPEPFIEVMTGISTQNQYVRLVDGDPSTTDPQQGFTSLAPWALAAEPALLTVAAKADPATVLAGTGCLSGGTPIGALPAVTPSHYVQPPVGIFPALPLIGVRSYTCTSGPQIVPDSSTAAITPGESLVVGKGAAISPDFRRLKLSILAASTADVRVTATLKGSVVGTIDIDIAEDCVNSSSWETDESLCATRVVPYLPPLNQRYLNLTFDGPFDSFELTATAGAVRLKGLHASRIYLDAELFGGTIGGTTGEESTSQPPTETLPGYEVACADASNPPPEGPCGGKEVELQIARYLADTDDDGIPDQVLDVVPTGAVEDLALLVINVQWAPEPAPTDAIALTAFDEDGGGPDDDDPAPWCSVDPPGAPGDAWCLDAFTSGAAGSGQIQVSESYQGTGDPRFTR